MGIASIIPMVARIIANALKLRGTLSSHTSKVQAGVVFIVSVIVSALAFFVPDVASPEVQVAIASGIIAVFGTVFSRALGYVEKKIMPPEITSTVWLCKVDTLTKGDTSWAECDMTIFDACAEGHSQGVDEQGRVWNVRTGQLTGETIELSDAQKERNRAAMLEKARTAIAANESTDNRAE